MAVKISDLPIITTATDDDYLPMVDPATGQTRRVLKSDLLKELRLGTDLGIGAVKANKADLSVADQTARDALLSPFDGMIVYRKDSEAIEAYDGTNWRTFGDYEILKRVTLLSAATSLSTGTFAARKNLKIIVNQIPTGSVNVGYRFNNDTANNYSVNLSANSAANTLSLSQANIFVLAIGAFGAQNILDIQNIASRVKIGRHNAIDDGASTSAGNVGNFFDSSFKWANTSNQITRFDVFTLTSTLAAGTEIIVLGKDYL